MLLKRNLLFKIFVAFLAFIMVFTTVYWVFAAGIDEAEMTANAIMLVDQDTGAVLYEKNPDARIAPASTTKIMTALVALDHVQLADEVTVGAEVSVSGSLMGLKRGLDGSVRYSDESESGGAGHGKHKLRYSFGAGLGRAPDHCARYGKIGAVCRRQ